MKDKKTFYKMVFALVIPIALQNLINVGVTSTDVIMMGKVGEKALAGVSLAGQIQFIMTLIYFGITSGASVLTAQYWGKGDVKNIEQVMGIALKWSVAIALLFTMAVQLFPSQLMMIFTSDSEVIIEGVNYLRIVSFSYIFNCLSSILLCLLTYSFDN